MLVSVIMPTYNYGRFIGAAIESVLQQTHEDFELLIVDDGSSDETHDAVAGFTDGRIMYQRVTNGGVSRARNVALDRARGEAVSFLDADDL
jgi:glycosyltransferase involved in cell wall biosynthesis